MFVKLGARVSLTNNEHQKFVDEEVPAFVERVQVLGMNMTDVVKILLETGEAANG